MFLPGCLTVTTVLSPNLATLRSTPWRASRSALASPTSSHPRGTAAEVTRPQSGPSRKLSNRSASGVVPGGRGEPQSVHFLLSRPLRLSIGEFQSRGSQWEHPNGSPTLVPEQGAPFEERNCRGRVMVGPGPAASAAAGKCGPQPPKAARPPPSASVSPELR